jgi:SAM-dependent methyltransferase
MSSEYGALATEVDELDKPVGHPFTDVSYYTAMLADVSGPILDPATGTGRFLIPLLEAGHQVEGLDSSPHMLGRCRQLCRDRNLDPVLRECDMTVFVQLAAYEAVIVPAGSIALLAGREAALQALTCFRDSLVPGGRLYVDVPMPSLIATAGAMRHWRRDPYIWTLQTVHTEYDPAVNQTTGFLRYDKWHEGSLRATELQIFRRQHWSGREFADLLAEAGFVDTLVTVDYEDSRWPSEESGVWTYQARTPRAKQARATSRPASRPMQPHSRSGRDKHDLARQA